MSLLRWRTMFSGKEAVAVTGTWDDSKMYVPYPYEDVILNPNLDNSWKN